MTNDESITNETAGRKPRPRFDLETRTARFGAAVIRFAKRLPSTPVMAPLIGQLVRAATSIGANYVEANNAESRKDFHHKIGLCRKEARETIHWLRMVAVADVKFEDDAKRLGQEAKELNLIFSAIRRRKDE